ncbi:NUDIX domain-containing protein [Tardiphaga sp. 709]|uniref:NUDIX hydrolase n=1 Tax=Tardiphaga sp. 709 TaxID=3076039 RepID=UPI0028EFDD79|nr:NUDIX domain-containing protein [Tardiphaga sp. 709]WNV11344.1 NUDIX domain-containing protein [Tardiphaga sp. 709]
MTEKIIGVVAALIRDDRGRMLVVRKRGTEAFMQPGGKRDAGEDDLTALGREIGEELGCRMVPGSAQALGQFDSVAANEPGWRVRASVYAVEVDGAIAPQAEIAEAIWINPTAPEAIVLAPLTRDHVLPLAAHGFSL